MADGASRSLEELGFIRSFPAGLLQVDVCRRGDYFALQQYDDGRWALIGPDEEIVAEGDDPFDLFDRHIAAV